MKYQVITAGNATALADKINEFIEYGWELQGGVAVASDGNSIKYAQALVRRTEPQMLYEQKHRRRTLEEWAGVN